MISIYYIVRIFQLVAYIITALIILSHRNMQMVHQFYITIVIVPYAGWPLYITAKHQFGIRHTNKHEKYHMYICPYDITPFFFSHVKSPFGEVLQLGPPFALYFSLFIRKCYDNLPISSFEGYKDTSSIDFFYRAYFDFKRSTLSILIDIAPNISQMKREKGERKKESSNIAPL